MAVEIITIPRVYINPNLKEHARSAHYRAMAPAPVQPNAQPGADMAIITLEFINGIARNVPQTVYDQFHALGIATTSRPKARWELDEDEGR